jgi:hypothetical protein
MYTKTEHIMAKDTVDSPPGISNHFDAVAILVYHHLLSLSQNVDHNRNPLLYHYCWLH